MANDFYVDWGDGSDLEHYVGVPTELISHEYATADDYTVTITGTVDEWNYGAGWDGDSGEGSSQLIEIQQWGSNVWGSGVNMFYECANVTITASDEPTFDTDTSINFMFAGCTSLTGGASGWDMTNVNSMQNVFNDCTSWNEDISGWDYSGLATEGLLDLVDGATSFSTANYDLLLNAFADYEDGIEGYLTFDAVPAYTITESGTAHDYLTGTRNWTINDGGGI